MLQLRHFWNVISLMLDSEEMKEKENKNGIAQAATYCID
jgi:hypothetical protein